MLHFGINHLVRSILSPLRAVINENITWLNAPLHIDRIIFILWALKLLLNCVRNIPTWVKVFWSPGLNMLKVFFKHLYSYILNLLNRAYLVFKRKFIENFAQKVNLNRLLENLIHTTV